MVVILGLGAATGAIGILYWESPENSVRWSFTQIHTSIVRKHPQVAKRFLAPEIVYEGKAHSPDAFLAAYRLAPEAGTLDARPCPGAPVHFEVHMKGTMWCFNLEGRLWMLHRVAVPPCPCRAGP